MSLPSSLPTLPELIERYLCRLRTEGKTEGTIRVRQIYLDHLVCFLLSRGLADVRLVTAGDIEAYRVALARHRFRETPAADAAWKQLTVQGRYTRLSYVRRFFRWLVAERVVLADPAVSCLIVHPQPRLPRRVPSELDMRRLLAAAGTATPMGLRDRAILELLYSSGLRLSELAALDLADLDLTGGTVLIRRGKGDKGRLVPLGETAAQALLAYIEHARSRWLRNPSTTALFLAAPHCGQAGQRLSKTSIWLTVRRAAARAGLRHISTHALRHAMATHLVRSGADVRHVQEILGHAKVETTEIYTHIALLDLAAVHARSHPRG